MYTIEIKDNNGSIYPAGEDIKILLRQSFEGLKETTYKSMSDHILEEIEPIILYHIEHNPEKFRGAKGDQGERGLKGEKGDTGDRAPLYQGTTSRTSEISEGGFVQLSFTHIITDFLPSSLPIGVYLLTHTFAITGFNSGHFHLNYRLNGSNINRLNAQKQESSFDRFYYTFSTVITVTENNSTFVIQISNSTDTALNISDDSFNSFTLLKIL